MRLVNQAHLLSLSIILLSAVAQAGDSISQTPDGVTTWTPAVPGPRVSGEYAASRWGMFDVEAQLELPVSGKIKGSIAGKELSGSADAASNSVKLGRVYLEKDGKLAVTIESEPADVSKPISVKALVLTPAPEGKPIVQADDLSVTLHARDATVHGITLRYEYRPDKNTLGYWGREKDWVSWDFELKKPGKYIVFVMHGSNGGSEIEITAGDQKLNWTTKNTGSFHTFTFLEAGTLTFDKPGSQTLALKPLKKVGGAVMDLRQVILLPVLK